MPTQYIIYIVIAVVVLWIVFGFNSLIKRRNRVKEAWSDIDVQLKRRYDLIPNLVETVKGYAAHERETFEKVINARSKAMGAQGVGEHQQAENILSGALKNLFALAEAYPQLRASENFQRLQMDLTDTEDKLQAARRFYNSTVRDYNTAIQQIPTNILASLFNFKEQEFFELSSTSEAGVPKVEF